MTAVAHLKQQKALYNEVHILFYENLMLLRNLYPMWKELENLCKPDMFVKNNNAAFQHVMYYLLKVYNPHMKRNTISWPIYSKKMEVDFRKEVVTYLNSIKHKHPECDLKTMVTSQLINPGGFKFTQFMLSISELVILEVFRQRSGRSALPPTKVNPKHPEQTQIMKKPLQKLTCGNEVSNARKLKDYYKKSDEYENEAEQITQEIHECKFNIAMLKERLVQLKTDSVMPYYMQDIDDISTDIDENGKMCKLFEQCASVLRYYDSDDCYLGFDTKEETGQFVSFLKHFQMFQKLSTAKIFDVRYVDGVMINQKLEVLGSSLQHCEGLLQQCRDLQCEHDSFMNCLKSDSRSLTSNINIPKIVISH